MTYFLVASMLVGILIGVLSMGLIAGGTRKSAPSPFDSGERDRLMFLETYGLSLMRSKDGSWVVVLGTVSSNTVVSSSLRLRAAVDAAMDKLLVNDRTVTSRAEIKTDALWPRATKGVRQEA